MEYTFYYKKRSGVEHISYISFNDYDEGEKYGKIGSINKLVDFIKRNCLTYSEVYFEGFESNVILYVLNNISDVIEVNYPPLGEEGPYQMYKRIPKVRGK